MRRTVLVAAVLLLSTAGCRSSVDLSTAKGQLRFGVQAARMELWREAQFRFLRAVEMNPDDPMAYNNLAVAYEGIGEFEAAREAYLRALRIDRSNQYIQRNYSRFVEFYSRKEARDEEAEEATREDAEPSDATESPVPAEPLDESPVELGDDEVGETDEAEPEDGEAAPDEEEASPELPDPSPGEEGVERDGDDDAGQDEEESDL